MLGRVEEIIDNSVTVKLNIDINEQPNLVNLHVIFEDEQGKKVVGEIANVNQTTMIVTIVGEIFEGRFIPGGGTKPSFKSTIRLIKSEELELLFGKQELVKGYTNFGTSNVYDGYKINGGINDFFNTHFSIIGNSGSGKSCCVASILQKLYKSVAPPTNSAVFFFDAYGEYTNAFQNLHVTNPALNYKSYTTNIVDPTTDILRIPIWLLDVDDLALLLDASTPSQLPIIEKTLKLVPILTGTSENVSKRKNDIIARALQDIMLSGAESTKIRDQVIGVLTRFNTTTLNLQSQIVQPGYTRTLKQCLFVDKTGKMQEMELVVEFFRGYIIDDQIDVPEEDLNYFYTLQDLEMAMEFALVSEGVLKSDKVYETANIMNVRLHSLATGDNRHYFTYPTYVTRDQYIESLLWDETTASRAQIINFNINYIDDRMAKVITKIISRMLFNKLSTLKPRGSQAFHVVIEEAHRYVRHDSDIDLLGYNIFERISKEGRKYGMFIGLITQRPSELSDTCVSQCANFIILRTIHPVDLKYIKEMVPNVSTEIMLQMKNLKPGNCIAFGSAFKVPTVMRLDLPNPMPLSDNVNLEDIWYKDNRPKHLVQDVSATMQQAAQQGTYIQTPATQDVNQIMQQQVAQQPVQQQVQQPVQQAVPAAQPAQ